MLYLTHELPELTVSFAVGENTNSGTMAQATIGK